MTPNKPVIAEEARKLLTGANSKLENDMLDMVSRLADVITYNAEAMNKLVARVEQLEKSEVPEKVETQPKVGDYLETVLKEEGVEMVMCTSAYSDNYIAGKAYLVKTRQSGVRCIESEYAGECVMSSSLFVAMRKGLTLQKLLSDKSVQLVKCIKANSILWQKGKVYEVLHSRTNETFGKVQAEDGQLLSTSGSLFVEVKPEPSEVPDYASQLTKEQRLTMFVEQTRMFMGLPTVQLIHPRSL